MLVLRFIHSEEKLYIDDAVYQATCLVRNEINGWRKPDEITVSMPEDGMPTAYYPRKFPTGLWRVWTPEYTKNVEFAPVKIPTNARRKVLLWDTVMGEYSEPSGEVQEDSYYHIHYSENSKTTLGCIRLDSKEDALEIAKKVIVGLSEGSVWLEVLTSK